MEGKRLPQELEFIAWGLSKIAVRNIVIFFIITLMGAISALSWVVVLLFKENNSLNKEILIQATESAQRYQDLQNENLKNQVRINEVLLKQREIRHDIEEAQTTIETVKEKIKR